MLKQMSGELGNMPAGEMMADGDGFMNMMQGMMHNLLFKRTFVSITKRN